MNYTIKKILFLTGTRADYGKMKSIMRAVDDTEQFEMFVFVTGMHMHTEYGYTCNEILKDGYKNVFMYINQRAGMGSAMDMILANTINGFSAYVHEIKPDLIIVHGDRLEALAATIVGAMNNTLVGHIEGGEVSGTIDESIRHAITKLAHIHFVANKESKKRIQQLGEHESRIRIIGSPDIDIMLSPNLPSWEDAKARYEIEFNEFGIAVFHPITTSYNNMSRYAKIFTESLLLSNKNFIIIHPNNDLGREFIVEEYDRLSKDKRFRIFASVRFEYFLTMLKQAGFIIGNSSAGIREASVYGIPAIDIGDRQQNRYVPGEDIKHCEYDSSTILKALDACVKKEVMGKSVYGSGKSKERFMTIIEDCDFWKTPLQKHFVDND